MSLQQHSPASPRRLLRLSEVKHLVGLGRSAIYDQIKRGHFPAPVRIGARAVAWASDQIANWIDSRIAMVRGDAAAGSKS